MSLFGPKKNDLTADILAEVTQLKAEVAGLRGEREALKDVNALEDERNSLQREVTDLGITFDREKEKWDREKRETEHMVGLQRQRGEFETTSGARDAVLTVREENLEKDKARFEEHIKFVTEQFEKHSEKMQSLFEKFLERMPTTEQLITVGGGRENGNKEE